MIHESGPWKRQLRHDADLLERWARKPNTERRAYILESKIMNSAYAIRRLAQSNKLSSTFDSRSVKCQRYRPKKTVTLMNHRQFWKSYDLETPKLVDLNVLRLIDVIIHSYVFGEYYDDKLSTEPNFVVTSDWKRNAYLYAFRLDHFVAIMRGVGADHPSVVHMVYNEEDQDYRMWRGNGDPPPHIIGDLPTTRRE